MKAPDFSKLELSIICSFYFDQRKADPLYSVLDTYASYSPELLSKIQFVLVDDCSKIDIAIPSQLPLNYQHLRIKTDIMWNNGGARNLAVSQARTSKILLTDLEQIFPEKLLSEMIRHRERKSTVYRFKRKNWDGKPLASAANIMYLSKGIFYSVLGYDEEFSGNYGYEDSFFLELLKSKGFRFRYLTRFSKITERSLDRKESYHNLLRDTTINKALFERKLARLRNNNLLAGHSRIALNFEWEKVVERMNAYY